jgi:hypothetical protein
MKEPTTPYSIAVQEKAQITRNFLESQGWKLIEEKPLYELFEHTKNADLKCSIGLYGGFSIVELHWCNKTPVIEFSTVNNELTIDDYHTIVRLLKILV